MKKWDFILGVDVSKLTLDIHCAEINTHIQIANGKEGFKLFKKWVKECKIDLKKSIMVMEYTGGYEYKLIQFCESLLIPYTRIPGLAIKQSLPAPLPRSTTTSPFFISANSVGRPQPSPRSASAL